ncbi:hypothetical protein PG985_007326 [Apiospora marii]|uniref:Nudix hydrolase domain-containing protein n=1 Tax=Apiospora marii TaxID=335849 RepID=A0ABR1SNX3_9PEZI
MYYKALKLLVAPGLLSRVIDTGGSGGVVVADAAAERELYEEAGIRLDRVVVLGARQEEPSSPRVVFRVQGVVR